jgi:hypothetical protein
MSVWCVGGWLLAGNREHRNYDQNSKAWTEDGRRRPRQWTSQLQVHTRNYRRDKSWVVAPVVDARISHFVTICHVFKVQTGTQFFLGDVLTLRSLPKSDYNFSTTPAQTRLQLATVCPKDETVRSETASS